MRHVFIELKLFSSACESSAKFIPVEIAKLTNSLKNGL